MLRSGSRSEKIAARASDGNSGAFYAFGGSTFFEFLRRGSKTHLTGAALHNGASTVRHVRASSEDTASGWAVPCSHGVSESVRAVLMLIAATMAVRILFAWSLGLGIDESYTVATGRHPQLSYFDHPPLAWWLAWAGGQLFGTEAPLAVRAPFIVLFAVTTWLMFSLTRLLFGERAGLWAAVTLNLAPMIAWTSGTWILPDGPLNAALLAGAYCLCMALFVPGSKAPLWWLAAGACGGLAMMAKLHGIFLFAGVGLFLITSPAHRRWLATPWPYLAVAVAAAIFTPVIIWNEQHAWVSLLFQTGRGAPPRVQSLGAARRTRRPSLVPAALAMATAHAVSRQIGPPRPRGRTAMAVGLSRHWSHRAVHSGRLGWKPDLPALGSARISYAIPSVGLPGC